MDSGTAFALPSTTGERLWRDHDLLAQPLSTAMHAVACDDAASFVDLRFAGATFRYMSSSRDVIERLRSSFAGACANLRSSPDLLVEIDPAADVDRLYRAVEGVRSGIRMRFPWEETWSPACGEIPALPPVQMGPLAGTYCGLHAALIATSTENLVVCGARRSGKTTSAVLAEKLGVGRILADELVFIDRMGSALAVPIPIRERSKDDRSARPVAQNPHGSERLRIHRIVVLEQSSTSSAERLRDPADAIRALLPHVRTLGGEIGLATVNVLEAVRCVPVVRWRVRGWPGLKEDLSSRLRTHEAGDLR